MSNQAYPLLAFAGFTIQGDFGPITTYTKTATKKDGKKKGKHTKVFFPKIWLSDPTTTIQKQHRDRIRAAARLWKNLCPCMRYRWEHATRRPRLHVNGYNLWTYWYLTGRDDIIHTIERNSGYTLLPPIFKTDYGCPTCPNKG